MNGGAISLELTQTVKDLQNDTKIFYYQVRNFDWSLISIDSWFYLHKQ